MDVVEFLFERIKEDEKAAQKLLGDRSVSQSGRWYEHRLLRECEAKRRLIRVIESARQASLARIVASSPGETVGMTEAIAWTALALHALAFPYSDHPDFQEGWRLTE